MIIKANHLTVLRIVLLPIPFYLVYGGTISRILALIVFFLLGLTDYLDGLLARRHGATALGSMLDPIADKIFLAVIMVPLVDLGLLPPWMIWPIFLREFLVSGIRRELSPGVLAVTEIAKIKTTVQMTGAGLVFMTATFPDKTVPVAFVAGSLLSAVTLAVAVHLRHNEFTYRMKAAIALLTTALVTGILLPGEEAILVYGGAILLITLYSGLGYLTKGMPLLLEKIGTIGVLELTGSILPPLGAAAVFHLAGHDGAVAAVLILSFAFSSQGMDIWLYQQGTKGIAFLRWMALFPASLAAVISAAWQGGAGAAAVSLLWTCLVLEGAYLLADAYLTIKRLREAHQD